MGCFARSNSGSPCGGREKVDASPPRVFDCLKRVARYFRFNLRALRPESRCRFLPGFAIRRRCTERSGNKAPVTTTGLNLFPLGNSLRAGNFCRICH